MDYLKPSLNVYNVFFKGDDYTSWQEEVSRIIEQEDKQGVIVIGAGKSYGKTFYAANAIMGIYAGLCNTSQKNILVVTPDVFAREILMHLTYHLLTHAGYTDVVFSFDFAQSYISVDACDAKIVFRTSDEVKSYIKDHPDLGALVVDDADFIDPDVLFALRSYGSNQDKGTIFIGNDSMRKLKEGDKDIWGNLLTDPFATVIYVRKQEVLEEAPMKAPAEHLFMGAKEEPLKSSRQSQAKEDAMTTLKALLGEGSDDILKMILR